MSNCGPIDWLSIDRLFADAIWLSFDDFSASQQESVPINTEVLAVTHSTAGHR
jgi:hypothetical protein